ncbi:MAG: cadherin-like domain-containing protein, partial [Leptolyngbyaceae cyanobacterium RM2_2_4]|nr:cadherin-like domain-containing protein [Leptolyngbyaceae cyanobacterium RM2_2_4]
GGGLVVLSNGLNKGLTIRDTAFTDNTATSQGGGLWTMDSPTTITGSLFSGNKVFGTSYSNVGGAMALYSPTDIVDTKILNNSAGWVGGGITAIDKFPVTVKDTVFYNNTADNGTNNWGIQQHTSRELADKGGNIQWPPKRTSNANDYNATAQITLAQPTASDLNTDGIGASSGTGSTTPATPGSGTDPVTPDTGNPDPATPDPGSSEPTPPDPVDTDPGIPDNSDTAPDAPGIGDGDEATPDPGNPDPATPDAGSSDPLPGKPIPLVAVPDTVTTKENTPVKINILANDTFSDKDSFTVTLVETAEKGDIRIDNNGTPNQVADDFVLYTPETNVTGADQFTYQIDKGDGNAVTATVKVSIAPESNSSPAPSPSPAPVPAPLPSPSPTPDPAPSPSPAPIPVSPLPSSSPAPDPAPASYSQSGFYTQPRAQSHTDSGSAVAPTPNPTPTPVSPLPTPTPSSTPDLASPSPTIPNRKPVSAPAKPMRYEAENLSLNNYRTEWFEDSKASAERQISLRGTGKTSGSAEGVFKGRAGVYQVKIGYYDEMMGSLLLQSRSRARASALSLIRICSLIRQCTMPKRLSRPIRLSL